MDLRHERLGDIPVVHDLDELRSSRVVEVDGRDCTELLRHREAAVASGLHGQVPVGHEVTDLTDSPENVIL